MNWVEGLTIDKDPDKVCDWAFDWTGWLAGDTIASYVMTVESGLTKDTDSNTDTAVTVWLSGGSPGKTYTVACKITTVSTPARVEERTVKFKVKQR